MNKLERLASAPMTATSADFLAQEYNGPEATIDSFVACLPEGARIFDMAAGASDLGIQVAIRRPDVEWTNIDVKYDDPEQLALLPQDPPDNLRLLAGDVLNMDPSLSGQFDQGYCYSFIPLMIQVGRRFGRQALRGMDGLLVPDGSMFVGKVRKPHSARVGNAIELPAGASAVTIEAALDALTMSRVHNLAMDAMNASGVSIFSSERFEPEAPSRRVLFDHRDGSFHRPASLGGIRLGLRLAGGLLQPNKFEDPE